MRRFVTIVIVVGLLAGAYYYLSQHARVSLGILEGKTVKAYRGDLVRPITASGKIEPTSIVKVKGQASGEVVEVPFNEGAMVRRGDLIVRLDPDDEQRALDQTEADYERARIALDLARLARDRQANEGIAMAWARVAQAEARRIRTQVEYDRKMPLTQPVGGMPAPVTREEWEQVRATKLEADALYESSLAELGQAYLAIEQADLEIQTAQENLRTADKRVEEARQRLIETEVFSPIDGMVLTRDVQIGEMTQSGTRSLMGGTVLMTIADVSDIYAVVNVDEADIGSVRELAPPSAVPGAIATQPATLPAGAFDAFEEVDITVEAFPEEKFRGVIERIAPQSQLIQAIATFKVWIRIVSPNRDKLVGLLNTQTEARFTVRSVENAILVSYDAIKQDPNGDGFGVYVPVANPAPGTPKYEFRLCEFGIDNGIDVEVIKGLEPGDEVYTVLPQMTQKEKDAQEKQSG